MRFLVTFLFQSQSQSQKCTKYCYKAFFFLDTRLIYLLIFELYRFHCKCIRIYAFVILHISLAIWMQWMCGELRKNKSNICCYTYKGASHSNYNLWIILFIISTRLINQMRRYKINFKINVIVLLLTICNAIRVYN